ncbi:hypothetical protein LL972_02960, partial [Xanthomonas campestris pv. asclepiadis]|uniref:hypothetical protein n=1 Tax=Xanthomonas campestris TaxID=339 RepID=UPI001E4C8F27
PVPGFQNGQNPLQQHSCYKDVLAACPAMVGGQGPRSQVNGSAAKSHSSPGIAALEQQNA